MADADAIVIGSGHNGLACGVILARRGWDVRVLEGAEEPGGACRTAEITEPGFKHDLYATNINLFLESPTYEAVGEEMHREGFELAVSDQPYASVYPEGDGLPVYTDPERTRSSFASFSEVDARAWEDLVDYFQEAAPHLFPLLRMPMPSAKAAKHLVNVIRRYGFTKTMELAAQLLKSPRAFTEYWFEHEKVKALFIPWAFHLDYGPDVSGGAMFPFLETVADHLNGMAFARGGAGELTRSLADVLEAEGGILHTGEPVEEVLLRDGKAVGVRTASGHEHRATKAVIGNLNPAVLFEQLIDPGVLPDSFRGKVENYRHGPGTMMMHFALRDPLEWTAGPEFANSAYVHVAPGVDDVARTYQQVQAGLLPDSPLLVVGQPTTVDPARAPEGKHVLWVQVRAVPPTIQGDAAGTIRATDWSAARDPFEERVLEKLERYAPNLRESTIDYATLGPGDLESDNPNLVGGDSVAGSHHLDQHWIFRPFPGWSRYETPVEDLYLCGASTWPGAGLNGTSGYLLADQLTRSTVSRWWDLVTS